MTSRILLVEDSPDVQLIVADLLRGHGHEVVVSGDGEDGLRVANEQRFDLMILDVMLPGMDGFDLCRAVREHWRGRLSHQAVRSEGTAGAD